MTSSWTVSGPDAALIISTGAHAPTSAGGLSTVWLSGGTLDRTYPVTNHITTAQGRINERTIYVSVRQE